MKQKLLRELRTDLAYMSTAEKKIAETILADPKRFTEYSLGAFAEAAQVSQGSVINFSGKYAGGGFPLLKMQIAAALSHAEEQTFSVIQEGDTLKDVLGKTVNNVSEAMKNTVVLNEEATLRSVAERMLRAEKIEIYGVYRSAVVATDFWYQLLRLGIPAAFVSDILTCAVSASMLKKESLVFAVSSSGKTQDIIDAVKLAKANGVPIVALTADRNSPLARLADEVLVASPCGNSVSMRDTEIRISQLALTDALCSYLREKIDADGSERYYKMDEILQSHNVKD